LQTDKLMNLTWPRNLYY